jgi:hypothetical protein
MNTDENTDTDKEALIPLSSDQQTTDFSLITEVVSGSENDHDCWSYCWTTRVTFLSFALVRLFPGTNVLVFL